MAGDGSSFWTTIPGILTAFAGVIAAVGSLVGALHKAGVLGKRGAAAGDDDAAEEKGPGSGGSATPGAAPVPAAARATVRSAPAVLDAGKVDAMLVRLDLFEERRNPAGKGVRHQWTQRVVGEHVVVEDGATGLTWQKVASERPMTLDEADGHIDALNARRWAGFDDWRLPTAEEAMTLMEPEAVDEFHLPSVFARGGPFVWTADRPPQGGGWVAYYYDGILALESEAFNAWIRAVR